MIRGLKSIDTCAQGGMDLGRNVLRYERDIAMASPTGVGCGWSFGYAYWAPLHPRLVRIVITPTTPKD